ncbi:MAG: hypothetical protein R3B40_25415 [Polyangiales bacterium]|nr:hypothetical protein [Sandaracinaceae bacterium]
MPHHRLAHVLFLLGCVAVIAPASRAEALCAMPVPSGRIVTPLERPVPRDGSLLVALDYGYVRGGVPVTSGPNGELTLSHAAALVRGATRIPLTPTTLPGGLVRLDFARAPADGEYTVEGLTPEGVTLPRLTIGGTLAAAPADPGLARVTHFERRESREASRGRIELLHYVTRVRLTRAVPGAYSFVVLEPVGGGDVQLIDVGTGGTELLAEATLGGRCGSPTVTGRGQVRVGSEVRALVVDMYGRVSTPGGTVRVLRGRAP